MAGLGAFGLEPGDLAPGDVRAAERDWAGVELVPVASPEEAAFDVAYDWLWREFGARGEVESRAVIASRLRRDPARATGGVHLLYRLWLVRAGGEWAGVRDATAIVPAGGGADGVVVHLSHVVVAPAHRRTGLAALLRAVPVGLAREVWTRSGRAGRPGAVVLAAEMEPWAAGVPEREARLRSYGAAGFRVVEPEAVRYRQPDFRAPEEMDAAGGPALLPMWLLVRRVGREGETMCGAGEVSAVMAALGAMYGADFRERDMAGVWEDVRRVEALGRDVRLMPPGALEMT